MKHNRRSIGLAGLAAVIMGVASQGAGAQEKRTTPVSIDGVKVISVETAKGLVGKAHFYDYRAAVSYGKGHIKGAIAMPYNGKSENSPDFDASLDQFDIAKLPADKAAAIVMYSDGPTGWKSYKASVQAARAGYKNIMWLRDGVDGWAKAGLTLD